MSARRGPRDIAKAALVIIEGMKGEPLDGEIEDVMTDAIWDAYIAGRESIQRRQKARAPRSDAGKEGGTR